MERQFALNVIKRVLGRGDLDDKTKVVLAQEALAEAEEWESNGHPADLAETPQDPGPAQAAEHAQKDPPAVGDGPPARVHPGHGLFPTLRLPTDLLAAGPAAGFVGYDVTTLLKWSKADPKALPRYKVGGVVHFSKADLRAYMAARQTDGPRTRTRTPKANGQTPEPWALNAKPSPTTGIGAIEEWDTVPGASYRTGVPTQTILEMVKTGRLSSRKFFNQRVISVRELQVRMRPGASYSTPWEIFSAPSGWRPVQDALNYLGIDQGLAPQVSKACASGKVANRMIGRLRFVAVNDLESWYLKR